MRGLEKAGKVNEVLDQRPPGENMLRTHDNAFHPGGHGNHSPHDPLSLLLIGQSHLSTHTYTLMDTHPGSHTHTRTHTHHAGGSLRILF